MCGFVGIKSESNVARKLYKGLMALQHRGQDACGISVHNGVYSVKHGLGLVSDNITEEDLDRMDGKLGLGHVRYPTAGKSGIEEAQPMYVSFPFGISLAFNGNVTNPDELRKIIGPTWGLSSSSDLELMLAVFAKELNESVDGGKLTKDAIYHAMYMVTTIVKGAYSVVGTISGEILFAFRDPYGIKPIVVGHNSDSSNICVASETTALDALGGYSLRYDLKEGHGFIAMDDDFFIKELNSKGMTPCSFEYVYFSRPDSTMDDLSVYKARQYFGKMLADDCIDAPFVEDVDVIVPVPESSTTAAIALSEVSCIPYKEALVKNRYIGRSFIMKNDEDRKNAIRSKLSVIKSEVEGRNVLLVDDSIVRGHTAKHIIKMVRDAGASKVFLASASPPLRFPCVYGIDMSTKNEFVAIDNDRYLSNREIARILGADAVVYISMSIFNHTLKSLSGREDFCMACFTGEYPTDDITPEVLSRIGNERSLEGPGFSP